MTLKVRGWLLDQFSLCWFSEGVKSFVMKHHLIQKLEDNLKGSEFQMSNDLITHWIYPCEGCGGIMYHLYVGDDSILIIELDSVQSIDSARHMWNRVSGLNPMTKRNFVDFLIGLDKTAKEQSKANETNTEQYSV